MGQTLCSVCNGGRLSHVYPRLVTRLFGQSDLVVSLISSDSFREGLLADLVSRSVC